MAKSAKNLLISYYNYKSEIELFEEKIKLVQLKIERLREDLKECNVDMEEVVKGIDYSIAPGGGGPPGSIIEQELMRAVNKTIRELERAVKEKYKLKDRIRRLKDSRDTVKPLLDRFTSEERELLELRYAGNRKKQLSFTKIGEKLPISRTTIYTMHENILSELNELLDK